MNEDVKPHWMYIVTGVCITIVVLAFARLSYGVILPFMRDGLVISYKEAGFLGTVTSLGYVMTVILAGIIASKWGGKNTILTGIGCVFFGFIGLTFTASYMTSLLFMFLLGLGTAFTYTTLVSLLTTWFPKKKGVVLGFLASGAGTGLLIAGVVVPYMNHEYPEIGWRLTWALFALLSLFVFILTLFTLKNPPQLTSKATTTAQTKDIYKNRDVINAGFIYGVVGATYIIQILFIMSFMIEQQIDPLTAGKLVALNGLLSIASGPIWGALSDRIGRTLSLQIAMGLTLLGTLLVVVVPSLLGFMLHMFIIGCTATGLFTLIQAVSTDQVEPKDIPVAFSYVTFYFAIGQLIGPAIAGWLIDDFGGFLSAFLFSSVVLGWGLYLTFKIRKSEDQKTEMIHPAPVPEKHHSF